MTELKKLVMHDAGISEHQASAAVKTVMEYLKARAPHAMHKHLDKMAHGEHMQDSIKEEMYTTAGEVKDKTVDALREMAAAAEVAAVNLRSKIDDFLKKKPQ